MTHKIPETPDRGSSGILEIEDAFSHLEHLLGEHLGSNVRFLLTPESEFEIVRAVSLRRQPAEKEVVARLAGTDTELWKTERPEGWVVLGLPHTEEAVCVVCGESIMMPCMVGLYYSSRPICSRCVLPHIPILAMMEMLANELGPTLTAALSALQEEPSDDDLAVKPEDIADA